MHNPLASGLRHVSAVLPWLDCGKAQRMQVYASANPVCSQRSARRVSYSALLGRRCLIAECRADMLLKLELSDTFWLSLPGIAGNKSSCTQHSRRAAPLDPSPVMQSCAACLNARPAKQSVYCELLCLIPLRTFTTSESMRSWPLQRQAAFGLMRVSALTLFCSLQLAVKVATPIPATACGLAALTKILRSPFDVLN